MKKATDKLSQIQKNNPDRYCDLEEYKTGYVCYLDILGFSKHIENERNFISIRDTINDFISYQINSEVNEDDFKVSIGSDSIIITLEQITDNIYLTVNVLEILIRKIMFLRKLIIKKIGTDIRAGITYGKYVHEGYKGQLYFGPAICDAVKISEKNGVVSCEFGEAEQPSGIFISNKLFNNGIECFHYYKEYLIKLNNGNYILNPYIFEYMNVDPFEFYRQVEQGNVNRGISKYEWWKLFHDNEKKQLEKHNDEIEKFKSKYLLYFGMLDYFLNNYVEKINKAIKMI